MFILSKNEETLTDERGNGYFIQPLDDDFVITCYANQARIFEGSRQECKDRMLFLACRLKARRWHGDMSVLVGIWYNERILNTIISHLDKLRLEESALDALAHIAHVLTLHKGCALTIEQFAAKMERDYDSP